MSTLGAVIAHELGHAIQPGWSCPVSLTAGDQAAVTGFENCLIRAFDRHGSSRSELTLSENWADAISVRTVLRYLRRLNTATTANGLVLWMQTWCSAGAPQHTPMSDDPHATPYLRVEGTMPTLHAFYTAFGAPANLPMVC